MKTDFACAGEDVKRATDRCRNYPCTFPDGHKYPCSTTDPDDYEIDERDDSPYCDCGSFPDEEELAFGRCNSCGKIIED